MNKPIQKEHLKWTAEITVDPTWIRDGFDLTAENLKDAVLDMIGYAYDHEVEAKILSSPEQKLMEDLQSGEVLCEDEEE